MSGMAIPSAEDETTERVKGNRLKRTFNDRPVALMSQAPKTTERTWGEFA